MKTLTVYHANAKFRPAPNYPNEATRRENITKLMDRLLVGAMAGAAVAVLLFFVSLA